ncbi:hypothetical protein Glove_514g3 [Diversispora epigaea]|uniref:Uncharacterized protein n=1 Tax=Diversispora epigaea TaxID=1348612 RepID=A0A397GHW7_9GLOM|nr:hypothetical protein Glove_514g3 [Diversispora epigaea]
MENAKNRNLQSKPFLAYSFVLDPDNDTYLNENVFTKNELHKIRHFQTKRELGSLLSSTRKNRKRIMPAVKDMKRKIIGRKGNMIICKITAKFGCAEAGRRFEEQNNECKTCKLETIGLLHTVEQPDSSKEDNQLQHLQDICNMTPSPSQK